MNADCGSDYDAGFSRSLTFMVQQQHEHEQEQERRLRLCAQRSSEVGNARISSVVGRGRRGGEGRRSSRSCSVTGTFRWQAFAFVQSFLLCA